ncbi:hypothetical protein L226DRAFT_106793 [Lentinus tigrinus ALCF2SS1-7]|uniref:Uncharacterized protein n=1 Tax=Lentinus tigrinus ALCF2SS1-6 TaxID=1328759 RepID=A0A5C2SCH7_9APHY|nr:hypothetical protein L227DRAFT_172693 [Lentinus tigrinus ALCF2SS1-6]RPD73268.1 hypothetical protein L226DRAFT_106793 [Lentinus tigrinus ALCF2SS1-7]
MSDPEDLLAESLETLYDHVPVAHSSAGAPFTYQLNDEVSRIHLVTPDTQASNWALHASSIWSSAIYVADHIRDLHLDQHIALAKRDGRPLRILELGAGAGLPSILIAKMYQDAVVTCSDYPDESLIKTLAENAKRNDVADRCRVVPYGWGSDPSPLMVSQSAHLDPIPGFDIVLAADTLWNSDTHRIFVQTLQLTLKRAASARVHLVAGLHTGRYVIASFLKLIPDAGLVTEDLKERRVGGSEERPWSVDRAEGEDEAERRRWVIWMVLRWQDG